MKRKQMRVLMMAVLILAGSTLTRGWAQAKQEPTVNIPKAGVPEIMTIQGEFVRAAYNNEGYVILGYRVSNYSIGEPWMLLEVGITLREGVPYCKLTRSAISLDTPDGKNVPLPSNDEFLKANLTAIQNRANINRDSINYFPASASRPCRIGFFAELDQRGTWFDQVELNSTKACVGRLFFPVDGGIKYGQHWLNVKLPQTLIRVPFRILTKDEEKLLSKNYKSISKQVKEAFEPKKK